MKDKLQDALNEISDEKIAEAAAHKKSRKKIVFRVLAAVLVLAVLISLPNLPMVISAKAVSTASGSRIGERPVHGTDAYYQWVDKRTQSREDAQAALEKITPFFEESAAAYMSGTQENRVWSPVNAYIALGMLAEITDGNSRQQILDALHTSDLDTLRAQVGGIWETVYNPNRNEICTLANSLWLDKNLSYNQQAMDDLAYYHYASVYQSDLQSNKAAKALQTWLSNNTGGLLKNQADGAAFPEDAVFTLASTVYFQSKWADEFSEINNTAGKFHSPSGNRTVAFMNKKEHQTTYYWGESFGAVALNLKNGTKMWFFLPDEDKTVDDVLAEGQYMDFVTANYDHDANSKYMKVNLSVPKFDIASSGDLSEMFQALGITDVFDSKQSDFTALTGEGPVFVTAVNQAARIIIDEEGVKAASYIEIPGAGNGMPPDEIIDFILNRPFLFVISGQYGIPIFSGVVNEP